MSRFKPLLFVIGLSLISAVSLRYALGRAVESMDPASGTRMGPPRADSADLARRFVGCGHFQFVFDSLGYRTGQWPEEIDEELAARRVDATFLARDGRILAVVDEDRGPDVGGYLIQADTIYVTLGPEPDGLRARLGTVGDSLGGRLERGPTVLGRLFIAAAVPLPMGCLTSGPG